jgi:hypothetical protein
MTDFFKAHPELADAIHGFAVKHPDAVLIGTGVLGGILGFIGMALTEDPR